MSGRTTFIIAHRPAVLQRVSRVLQLEKGSIVQGSIKAVQVAA